MRYEIDVEEYGTILIGRTPDGCITFKITDTDSGGEYDILFTENEMSTLLYAVQLCRDSPTPARGGFGVRDRGVQDK